MKKYALTMLLLLLVVLLAGCQNASVSTVEIAKTDETNQFLKELLGPGAETFEVKLSKDARSIHVNVYQLENGKWEPLIDGGRPVRERQERLIINFAEDGITYRDVSQYLTLPLDETDIENRSIGTARITETTRLAWDAENPVFLYIASSAPRMTLALNDFFHPENLVEHERVYAMTVMVSREDAD